MRLLIFLVIGVAFGVIMTKSEAISWFRIQEMFYLQSFHMYGIIGSAITVNMLGILCLKKWNIKSLDGAPLQFAHHDLQWKRRLYGGTLFGVGWAMTGACPGPLYVLLGNGYSIIVVIIASALVGAVLYHGLKKFLAH